MREGIEGEKRASFSTPLKYGITLEIIARHPLAQYARQWQLNKPIGYDLCANREREVEREREREREGVRELKLFRANYLRL